MTKSDRPETTRSQIDLDQPGHFAASVDVSQQEIAAHSRRLKARMGDRASHRAHHGLYEDMLK